MAVNQGYPNPEQSIPDPVAGGVLARRCADASHHTSSGLVMVLTVDGLPWCATAVATLPSAFAAFVVVRLILR
ncbi:hypothetical protein [Amycolatopsis antarctica]|uniref:hypothetical protein n=1 Tax=Amycolatopsis antarctica TaxID=1854586 RepID=UPI00105475F6|nr:hypothetical protein [Amycolatopsis antarctica]